jgi:hypothetical protein
MAWPGMYSPFIPISFPQLCPGTDPGTSGFATFRPAKDLLCEKGQQKMQAFSFLEKALGL